jgi:hypothetical protein
LDIRLHRASLIATPFDRWHMALDNGEWKIMNHHSSAMPEKLAAN